MAFDVGINFRATSGYVTDGANETYSLGEQYPVTRGGATFGWNVDYTSQARDRDSGNDRRLAGIVFTNSAGKYFQIDLPSAGTYKVYCAAGDTVDGNSAQWDLCDTSTVLQTLTGDVLAAQHFKDATNTELTNSTWPGSNAPITATFSTTALRVKVNATATSNNVLAHVRVQSVDAPNPRRQKRTIHEPTPEFSW